MKNKVLDEITAADALSILRILAEENKGIAKRIEEIAVNLLSEIDSDDIASEVYFELDLIEVEELWDRSGSTRYGYIDPGDMAWRMFEEKMQFFIDRLKKYQKLAMYIEAKDYCIGILKGISRYIRESNSEFKNWAVDIPEEFFEEILEEWKKRQKGENDIVEVERIADELR